MKNISIHNIYSIYTSKMQRNIYIIVGLLVSIFTVFGQVVNNGCNYRPPEYDHGCGYTCLQQLSRWQFLELMGAMPKCPTFTFYLSNGYYHSFPEKFFSSIGRVHHFFLEITNVTFSHFPNSVGSVSPFSDVVFDVSIYLQLVDVHVRGKWNWKAFEDLKPDKGGTGEFLGYGLNMEYLDKGFSHVLNGSLRTIRFSGGNLRVLHDGVFSGLHGLTEVYLHDNQIEEVRRNLFASPANVLESLILRGNRITSLPINMFIHMPRLKYVDVNRNPLLTLSEATFRPILSRAKIIITENLYCNCDLRWLKYAKKDGNRIFNTITCDAPSKLENRSLYDVTDDELGC